MLASRLVSFVMLPVYTRVLTPSDYGVLELLGTTIDLIGMVAGVGLSAGVFRMYAEAQNETERRRLIATTAVGAAGLALLVMSAGWTASPLLTRTLFGPEQTPLYFRLFFVIHFLQAITGVGTLYIQAQERAQLFVAVSVARLVTALSLMILFVVHLRLGVLGVLIANGLTSALFAAGLGVYLFRTVGPAFSSAVVVRLARFGAPIAVWTVGSFVMTFSDRYFLNYSHGAGAVGVYSLAYKFSFLLSTLAVMPFSQSWEPRRFAIAGQPDAGAIYRRMFLYLNLALFAGASGIMLFIRDGLTVVVGEAYRSAYRVVPLLLVATIMQQWTAYANLGLYLKDATRLYAWAGVVGVAAALAGNALLIPRYGMLGAAWATVFAYAVRFVPVYVWSQARYRIEYPWREVAALGTLYLAGWMLRQAADALSLVPSLVTSLLIAGGMGIVMYLHILDAGARLFVSSRVRRAGIPAT